MYTTNSTVCPTNNSNLENEDIDKIIGSKIANLNDYKEVIYDSLPSNAKKYYVSSNKLELDVIVSKFNLSQRSARRLNMLRLYPFAYCKYASDNELVLMVINGEYKIYKGPLIKFFVNKNFYEAQRDLDGLQKLVLQIQYQ